jgi:hypothetical protein
MWIVALTAGLLVPATPQDKKKPAEDKALQMKVDAAIKKGVEYLRQQVKTNERLKPGPMCPNELVLLALIHSGAAEDDPEVQKFLGPLLQAELQSTYCVSVQAMVLEELERVKHQGRIAQCAQFLVDNQGKKGHWTYGKPTTFPPMTPSKAAPTGGKARPSKDPAGAREKPKVVSRIPVRKQREGEDDGDNSNSQYAALGLRACHDAGIVLPPEVVELALRWWRGGQKPADSKEGYPSAGWDYGAKATDAYGSMTAGAVGAIVIYDYIKEGKLSWFKDRDVQEGLQWMAKHFSPDSNPAFPGPKEKWSLYYLYAVERLGMLYGTERFGTRAWYPEGAKVLLDAQKPDGSWWMDTAEGAPLTDTCFALLFLRRATRPLVDVPSVDRFAPADK